MCNNPFRLPDWTNESLKQTWEIIEKIGRDEFKLDFYSPYFEVVTFEEMLQIYTTSFPIMYDHWSFGMEYENLYRQYKNNRMSIAYEVIFNTNPALCYLLDTNSPVMQGLVLAHASCGHSAFFKMNTFMRENTNAKLIISFMKNMREFVADCETKYGHKRVEQILDVCKSLSLYAIDKADKVELTAKQKEKRRLKRLREEELDFDLLVTEIDGSSSTESPQVVDKPLQENILKFIAKYSPTLKQWERELILMFCKTEQYFYPQRLTKMINEGFASFWHYNIMQRLSELGYLNDGDMLEFLHSHTSVLCQRDHDHPGYSGVNPYKLGYEIFNEIKRICTNPTEEDKKYFPDLVGKNWIDEVNFAATNFRDTSFILQYLSPKLVRDFKLLKVEDNSSEDFYKIKATHGDEDFREIRASLAEQYNLYSNIPDIRVEGAALKGSRALFLTIKEGKDQRVEAQSLKDTLELMKKLWPYKIKCKYQTFDNEILTFEL